MYCVTATVIWFMSIDETQLKRFSVLSSFSTFRLTNGAVIHNNIFDVIGAVRITIQLIEGTLQHGAAPHSLKRRRWLEPSSYRSRRLVIYCGQILLTIRCLQSKLMFRCRPHHGGIREAEQGKKEIIEGLVHLSS